MGIGNLVNTAVGSLTGSGYNTGLKDFLNHFSATGGEWIKTIDPYNTFEVSFTFYPNAMAKDDDGPVMKALKSIGNSALNMAKDLANNAIGGLAGNLMNYINGDVTKQLKKYDKAHKQSIMNPLVKGQMLSFNDENLLKLELGFYCQEITIPQIEIPDGGTSSNLIGDYPINGTIVRPNTNRLTMSILNTKLPLIDRIFYPWMQEVVAPFWSYLTLPYTTADIVVDFTKHSSVKYKFLGCRPNYVTMQQANQRNVEVARQVSFLFDYMVIDSDLENMDSVVSKLTGTAMSLVNSGANMMNL